MLTRHAKPAKEHWAIPAQTGRQHKGIFAYPQQKPLFQGGLSKNPSKMERRKSQFNKSFHRLMPHDRPDPGKGINHHRQKGAIPESGKARLFLRLMAAPPYFSHQRYAVEQQPGFLRRQHRRLAFFDHYFGPRTAEAGLTASTWPTTSQSNSMRIAPGAA